MKLGLKKYIICVLLILLCCLFSGYSTDENPIIPNYSKLTEKELNMIVGTYVGENGSVLLLKEDGRVIYFYYGYSYKGFGKWNYANGKVTFYESMNNCEVYAKVGKKMPKKIAFKSKSDNWTDEEYIKCSDKYEDYKTEDYLALINKYYPNVITNKKSSSKDGEIKFDYACVRDCKEYKLYYLIDVDTNTVLYFSTNDESAIIGEIYGDINSGFTVKWSKTWNERLSFFGSFVTLTDKNGFDWDYKRTSVKIAENDCKKYIKKISEV